MNKPKIQTLLKQWDSLIKIGQKESKGKAGKSPGGLDGRIKRTTGASVIFDSDTFEKQSKIQVALCKELPKWSDLINSQPEIMDGHPWKRGDFIDLYFNHFGMVIEKLNRIMKGTDNG